MDPRQNFSFYSRPPTVIYQQPDILIDGFLRFILLFSIFASVLKLLQKILILSNILARLPEFFPAYSCLNFQKSMMMQNI